MIRLIVHLSHPPKKLHPIFCPPFRCFQCHNMKIADKCYSRFNGLETVKNLIAIVGLKGRLI